MRLKINLMMRLIIGMLGSIIMLTGCVGSTAGENNLEVFVYNNHASSDIKIEKYLDGYNYGTWKIERDNYIELHFNFHHSVGECIYLYDSVRVVCNTKEMWYRRSVNNEPYSPYSGDNYIHDLISKGENYSTYTFTNAQFDLATQIKN